METVVGLGIPTLEADPCAAALLLLVSRHSGMPTETWCDELLPRQTDVTGV